MRMRKSSSSLMLARSGGESVTFRGAAFFSVDSSMSTASILAERRFTGHQQKLRRRPEECGVAKSHRGPFVAPFLTFPETRAGSFSAPTATTDSHVNQSGSF
jgi:hypothetical protein